MSESKPGELQRVHIWVRGRVQGVGFRSFIQQSGSLLGLTGWVRNVGRNQVEMLAEGQRQVLEKFIEIAKTGPRVSHVDEARVEWETPLGEFKDFGVKYNIG
jgi:acylphosphatase